MYKDLTFGYGTDAYVCEEHAEERAARGHEVIPQDEEVFTQMTSFPVMGNITCMDCGEVLYEGVEDE